jgi:hypothetical protein
MLGIQGSAEQVPIDFSEVFEAVNSRQVSQSIVIAMVKKPNNEVTLPNLARWGFAKFG